MNRSSRFQNYIFFIALGALAIMAACSEKALYSDDPLMFTPGLKAVPRPHYTLSPTNELVPIYFEYNRSDLSPTARKTLQVNADWIRKNPEAVIQIEGRCDVRGSEGYNLSLGLKRAQVARNYLIRLGIDESRVSAHSYGEVYKDAGESAARSRKAAFIIVYPESQALVPEVAKEAKEPQE